MLPGSDPIPEPPFRLQLLHQQNKLAPYEESRQLICGRLAEHLGAYSGSWDYRLLTCSPDNVPIKHKLDMVDLIHVVDQVPCLRDGVRVAQLKSKEDEELKAIAALKENIRKRKECCIRGSQSLRRSRGCSFQCQLFFFFFFFFFFSE